VEAPYYERKYVKYAIRLDNGNWSEIEIQGFASLIKYDGELYLYKEATSYSREGYYPIDAITIPKSKDNKPLLTIAPDTIVALRADISRLDGYSTEYRNRQGKQYLTIKSPHVINYAESRKATADIITQYAPLAQHTSGGGGVHTWRLNPGR
jgi:hypothetical protein